MNHLQGIEMTKFNDDETGEVTERPEFHATEVSLMSVIPGNYDHAEGEKAVIVTMGKKDMSIEQFVFSMDDGRTLVTKVLVALATYDDEFAQKLLDDHFTADNDGNFVWPRGWETA
jgi:hypothetical protein